MNESEQAQAINGMRELNELAIELGNDSPATLRCRKLLEIVGSQAQKIADQSVEIKKLTEERDKARRITEQYRGHDESDVLPWEKQ